MGPVASRLLLAFALIGGSTPPLFADTSPSWTAEKSDSAILPEFIPPTVRSNYREAVSDNTAAAISARRAAGELSAKFSEADTSSGSSKVEPPVEATDANGTRAIVLAANRQDDPKTADIPASSSRRARAGRAEHRIPRSAVERTDRAAHGSAASHESLAMIGQKVGFFDLLTNPALWKWK